MTDRDALRARLDAVAEDLPDTSTGFGTRIVYTDGDEYVTPDGDPVPADDAGEPDLDVGRYETVIVFDGRYAPRKSGEEGGDV